MTKFYRSLKRRTKICLSVLISIWVISLFLHYCLEIHKYDSILWYFIGLAVGWDTSPYLKDEDNEKCEEEEECGEKGDK